MTRCLFQFGRSFPLCLFLLPRMGFVFLLFARRADLLRYNRRARQAIFFLFPPKIGLSLLRRAGMLNGLAANILVSDFLDCKHQFLSLYLEVLSMCKT